MAKKPRYKIIQDSIAKKDRNSPIGRSSKDYLEDILDDIARCCGGYSCCDEALIMFARDTGDEYRIYADGGQLVLENVATEATSNIDALP